MILWQTVCCFLLLLLYQPYIVVDNLLQGSRYVVHRLFVSCYIYLTFLYLLFSLFYLPKNTTFIGEYICSFFSFLFHKFQRQGSNFTWTISTFYAYIMCFFSLRTSHVRTNPRNNKFACAAPVIIYIRKVGLVQMVSFRK